MRSFFKRFGLYGKLEFSQQLVITIIVGVTLLAASTSLSIAFINNKSVKTQMMRQASYLTELIARQSRLALLYQSSTTAQEVAAIAMEYPDVVGVKITNENSEVLFSYGEWADVEALGSKSGVPFLENENDSFMVFTAPVIAELLETNEWQVAPDASTESSNSSRQHIGYVSLLFSKGSLKDIQSDILQGNVLVSLVVAVLLLAIVVFLARRMTIPLKELSRVMDHARRGEINLRTSVRGPRDIVIMQHSFNTMMEAIEYRDGELRKARDIALETAEIKSQFAASVSHELRTPMNSVLGMLDLLEHMGLSGKQLRYVETAKSSAQNLLALIDDILSYVHVDSGNVVLDEDNVKLVELVESVINLLSSQALRKKLDIGYVILGDVDCAYLDAQRVKQVLTNLIGNAVKFTDIGQVSLTISVQHSIKDNLDYLHFAVSDTGIGIQPHNVDKIFEAFTQEDSTTTRKYGGTGLGLAICRQFAKLMGGDVSVSSEPYKGSTFTLKVPYKNTDQSISAPKNLVPALASKHIVIADDAEISRLFLVGWAVENQASCDSLDSAHGLIKYFDKSDTLGRKVDYLFIDESLPGAYLPDLLRTLKGHRSFSDVRIVVLVNPWTVEFPKDLESCILLEKPLTDSKLSSFIKSDFSLGLSRSGQDDSELTERFNYSAKVLVVDDNKANRLVAGGMLEHLGCDFDYAQNGQEAVDRVARKQYDLILMDCNMPVMDGYEATRVIRRLENPQKKLPILAMTANNSPEEFDHVIESGMDDLLIKPLSIDGLNLVLTKYFDAGQSIVSVPSTQPAIDYGVLDSLRSSVGEVFQAVINAYVDDLPVYLAALKKAVAENKSQQVYELAHTVKGSSSSIGALVVSNLAKQMESLGKAGDVRSAESLFAELDTAAIDSVAELRHYLRELPSDDSAAQPKSDDKTPTILIADDDRSIRLSMVNALKNAQLNTVELENGQSVIAYCSRTMPDIILLDAIMPEMDGFETCKRIRQLPNGGNVPILIVTSLEDEKSITQAFTVGATDFITKPVNYSVLKQRVNRLLQTSKTEQYVRELAYHDVLTGLPNRAFFNQQLRHKINRADLNGKKLALLFLDLDRFKLINDSLGHDAGDLVLKAAADRILRSVRKNDMVSRLGGDEFTVVFEDIESADFAAEISKKICDSLRAPFVFMHQRMFVTASIGIAVFPEHGKDSNSLIKHADTAMFKAKEAGLDYCYYEEGMEDEVTQKIQTEQDLRSSLDHGEIIFHYQPQVELATKEVVGFESLARWMHPTRGVISAFNFIEIAEETGLIGQMSDLAFRNACDQLEAWHTKGFDVRLAVNVSTTDFRDGHFRNKVLTLFDEDQYHFPPSMLEVEITESTLMEQPEAAQEELSVLRAKGVSIAIDDFGSGFSSLNYLKRFTVDLLKIDREFVIDCVTDKNDQAIITGIVTLAKSLGLKVIAEGVETAEQAAFLSDVGCEYAQGYFFGRPASADEINRAIESGLFKVKRHQT